MKYSDDLIRESVMGQSVTREFTKGILNSVGSKKDQLIKDAIVERTNKEFDIESLTGRLHAVRLSDGSELYILDNEDLIKFMPPTMDCDSSSEGHNVSAPVAYWKYT